MPSRQLLAATLFASLLGAGSTPAEEVRYYEKNGVTWCETRRMVDQRVPESRMEERAETVYREQFGTEIRSSTRTYWTPVTEYRWESYWVGRWNLLAEPYLAYRYVPHTHWEERIEVVNVPVNVRRLVPETRTVRRPAAGFRTVRREMVSRVPVGAGRALGDGTLIARSTLPAAPPAVAQRTAIGGISRMDNDPPRHGTATAWRASTRTVR
jgi:hypothetical protein